MESEWVIFIESYLRKPMLLLALACFVLGIFEAITLFFKKTISYRLGFRIVDKFLERTNEVNIPDGTQKTGHHIFFQADKQILIRPVLVQLSGRVLPFRLKGTISLESKPRVEGFISYTSVFLALFMYIYYFSGAIIIIFGTSASNPITSVIFFLMAIGIPLLCFKWINKNTAIFQKTVDNILENTEK